MIKLNKACSEIDWQIKGAEIIDGGRVRIIISALNYYFEAGSVTLVNFYNEFNKEWLPCLISSETDNIPLTGKYRDIPLVWESAKDLGVMRQYRDIPLQIQMNDRPNGEGRDTEIKSISIPFIDWTVKNLNIIRPFLTDPYFKVQFISPITAAPAFLHFILEVGDKEDMSGEVHLQYDTRDNILGWKCDDEDFPLVGVESTVRHQVTFEDEEITNLPPGEYFVKITPVARDWALIITDPLYGELKTSNTVVIKGEILSPESS